MRDKPSPGISISPRLLLFLITAVVLLYGVIYPNLYVLAASFQRSGAWTLANYRDVLTQRTVIEAIVNSLGLSVATVLLCALVGIPLAFLFERYAFPGRQLFAVLVFGESGILARSMQTFFHWQTAPWTLRGWPALLLFHTYTMYPFFYVLTGAGLRRIDAGLAEAARSLGAARIGVLLRVVLPQLTPSLIAAGLLTFMTSMASFSAPLLFGGSVRVLTLEIFTARQRGDAVMAVTETVILLSVSLAALVFFQL